MLRKMEILSWFYLFHIFFSFLSLFTGCLIRTYFSADFFFFIFKQFSFFDVFIIQWNGIQIMKTGICLKSKQKCCVYSCRRDCALLTSICYCGNQIEYCTLFQIADDSRLSDDQRFWTCKKKNRWFSMNSD